MLFTRVQNFWQDVRDYLKTKIKYSVIEKNNPCDLNFVTKYEIDQPTSTLVLRFIIKLKRIRIFEKGIPTVSKNQVAK